MILPPGAVSDRKLKKHVALVCAFIIGLSALAIKDGWHLDKQAAQLAGYYGSSYVRFRNAAEAGDASAQNSLGNHYYLGLGVEKNVDAAANWYQRAAFSGYSAAQINMGLLHANGTGVPLDLERAYGWFRLAHRRGNERAKIYVDYMAERYSMAPNMTKDIEIKFKTLADFK